MYRCICRCTDVCSDKSINVYRNLRCRGSGEGGAGGVEGRCRGGAGGLSEPGGTPKWRQEAKMIKRGGPFNSLALLEAIFEENGLQDGGQNRQKIDKKVIQNLIIF